MNKIPCHIIAGMLGSGKTTAIRHYLQRRQHREHTAVLVNDFGPNGIDSTQFSETVDESRVVNIPGGCLCCSSAARFRETFGKLVRLPRVDRIIIEPSGVVLLDELLDTMQELAEAFPIELRPVVLMVEPVSFNRLQRRGILYGARLAELADIIVCNFADTACPTEQNRFMQWTRTHLPPGKRIRSTAFGKLPDSFFESRRQMSKPIPLPERCEYADHTYCSGGLQLADALVFDPDSLGALLLGLAESGLDSIPIHRFKGIFQTRENPMLFEIAHGRIFRRKLAHADGNRIDWISESFIEPALMQQKIQQDHTIVQPVSSISDSCNKDIL